MEKGDSKADVEGIPDDPAPDHDDELLDIEVDKDHLLTHLPKSKHCPVCIQAKLYDAPHRKRANQREYLREIRDMEEPKEPLERVACDHVISRTHPGIHGEQYTFVTIDRYSGLVGSYPLKAKNAEGTEEALRRFCGSRKAGIVSVASDRAPEILAALTNLGFASEPAEPGNSIHNPFAESFIRTLKGISASILLQSGLSHEFWPLAHRYIEWAYPITKVSTADPEITCYEAHHGYAYEGVKAPFGCLVYIKSVDPLPFAPKGEVPCSLVVS